MSSGKFLGLLLLLLGQMGSTRAVYAAPLAQVEIKVTEQKVPCATAEFNYFFRVFVRGLSTRMPRTAIRDAYVWPQVEVRSDRNPQQLLATAPKQDYNGSGNNFIIGLLDNLWVYLDPKITDSNYPRLEVKFKNITREKVKVEYSQAEYAPITNGGAKKERLVRTFGKSGAYIFEHRLGCWQLTQELRSAKISP